MITSAHNPKVQMVRGLLARTKDRREARAFVVEGVRLAEEALRAGWPASLVFFAGELTPRGQALLQAYRSVGAEVEEVSEGVLKSISDTETPQGILAVLPMRELPLPSPANFVLIADTIRDPGNLGTLLRTAAAAGAQAALLSEQCADPFAPKVVRSAMGAHFRLAVRKLAWAELSAWVKGQPGSAALRSYLADMDGQKTYWEADFRAPCAILVGSEAEGASPEGQALADEIVRIPMPGESESLNAAVAAGILLFEVVRQRSQSKAS